MFSHIHGKLLVRPFEIGNIALPGKITKIHTTPVLVWPLSLKWVIFYTLTIQRVLFSQFKQSFLTKRWSKSIDWNKKNLASKLSSNLTISHLQCGGQSFAGDKREVVGLKLSAPRRKDVSWSSLVFRRPERLSGKALTIREGLLMPR